MRAYFKLEYGKNGKRVLMTFYCVGIWISVENKKKGTIHGRAAHDMCKQHTDKHIYCLNRVYELFINGTQFRY